MVRAAGICAGARVHPDVVQYLPDLRALGDKGDLAHLATALRAQQREDVVDTGNQHRKDAAFQIFANGLADIGIWRVVVALPVKLAHASEIEPGLEVFGDRLVEQRALGVTRVVELGFGARWPARVRMRVYWAGDGGHGAVPAWAGCLILLGLYPAVCISRKAF